MYTVKNGTWTWKNQLINKGKPDADIVCGKNIWQNKHSAETLKCKKSFTQKNIKGEVPPLEFQFFVLMACLWRGHFSLGWFMLPPTFLLKTWSLSLELSQKRGRLYEPATGTTLQSVSYCWTHSLFPREKFLTVHVQILLYVRSVLRRIF